MCKVILYKSLRNYIWWKQQGGNTDFLTWLVYPPCGLVPMSTWKIPYRTFFLLWNRASRVDFSDLVKNFQIWPCFCVHEKIIILSILGAGKGQQAFSHYQIPCSKWKKPQKLNRLLWPAQNAQNELLARSRAQSQKFWILLAEPWKTNFCSSETKSFWYFGSIFKQ